MSEPAAPLDRHPRDRLRRELRLGSATLLVVSSVVGSGIFFTPGRIAELLPHPGWFFAAWVAGGLLSLAGALANAELGAMFPHAGGDYVYLREGFHPAAGFLLGWLSFFVIYTGTIATLAAAFAERLAEIAGLDPASALAVACALTAAASAINYFGVRWGALGNNLTAGVKIAALLALALVPPLVGGGSLDHLVRPVSGAATPTASAFALALSPVLFSYLGWNASIYVASEIRDPERNVPRSLLGGLGVCITLYLVVNAVYLYAVPLESLRGVANAGEAAAAVLFGRVGATIVTVFVLASVLGTLNATILVGPRIAYAMALDGLFFRGVEQAHARFHTPHGAIAIQGAVSIGLLVLLFSEPGAKNLNEKALDTTVIALVLATMADVLALYALRWRQPERRRPYRAWGYPVVPALYVAANAWIAWQMLVQTPTECVVGLAMAATGLPFYGAFRRRGDP